MKNNIFFFVAIVFLLVVVVGFIAMQESVVRGGERVVLATRPVDPRDLFRGEYVILRYAIENDKKISAYISENFLHDGDTIYLQLAPGRIATVSSVQSSRPGSFDGYWIQGEVTGSRVRFPDIEQYFVPEGAGRLIERLRSDLHVEVALKNGEARVTSLLDADLKPIDVKDYIEK